MFTGIIEEVGRVRDAKSGALRITSTVVADARLGDSIAVNGVDLTVSNNADGVLAFNLMPETYRRSNLATLRAGDRVNLERSVRPSDRLSGHIVRGVVEGTARLASLRPEGEALIATFQTEPVLLRYMVRKGPICVDGISLTITEKTADTFSVSLVQYTQEHTALLDRRPGDTVNIETDILARYVETLLDARDPAAAELRAAGAGDQSAPSKDQR